MLGKRIIPTLLFKDGSLVKTIKYGRYNYIGDPVNTCRIFNELEVDELCFLDIFASVEDRGPNFELLSEVSNECFMPLSYGGGITNIEQVERIFKIGFEKVVINTSAFDRPSLIGEIASRFGTQAIVASVDVKRNLWGKYEVFKKHGSVNMKLNPSEWAKHCEDMGAGEVLLNDIDREGTWKGMDVELIKLVSSSVNVPLIAHGGVGSLEDIAAAFFQGNASAVAVGSIVLFQQKGMGVLVNYPDCANLRKLGIW